MYLIVLSFIFIFFNAFAEQKLDVKNVSLSGNFTAVGGNNYTDIKNGVKQDEVNGLIQGNFKIQHLTSFNSDSEDSVKYGFTLDGNLDSTNTLNAFNINEATFVISIKDRGSRVFGLQNSVASKMRVDSTTFNPHSNGVNGAWQKLLLFPSGSFLTSQGMMLENGFSSSYFLANSQDISDNKVNNNIQPFQNWGNSNLGLSYVSDRTNGFRFGASYFVNNKTNLLFQKNNLTDRKKIDIKTQNDVYVKDIVSTGLNYYNAIGNLEFAFSFGYEFGNTVSPDYSMRNLNSYSVGANLSYLGFTLGGSFTDLGKSGRIKNKLVVGNNAFLDDENIVKEARNDYIFDVGLGYAIDKYSISTSYIKSSFVNNEFWAGVLSFEVQAVENLANYIQIARYQFSSAKYTKDENITKSSGFIVTLGIKYIF